MKRFNRIYLKEQRGAATALVVFTVLSLIAILMGVYGIVASKTQSQLKSDARIQEIYSEEVANVNEIYDEVIHKSSETLAQLGNVGDYVAYNPTKTDAEGTTDVTASLLTYTSPIGTDAAYTAGNGYGNQTFTANSNIKWRILKKDSSTGEVVLISEAPIKSDESASLYLQGAKGYLYAEKEINELCKIYGYGYGTKTDMTTTYKYGDTIADLDEGSQLTGTITGSGARSINVDDVNRMCGITTEQQLNAINNEYGTTPYTHTIYYPTISTANGKSTAKAERSERYTRYYYNASTYLTDTSSELYKMLFRDIGNANYISYWLGSYCVGSTANNASFYVNSISNGCIDRTEVCVGNSSNLSESSKRFAIRPIVYLRNNIQTKGKNANNAWILK